MGDSLFTRTRNFSLVRTCAHSNSSLVALGMCFHHLRLIGVSAVFPFQKVHVTVFFKLDNTLCVFSIVQELFSSSLLNCAFPEGERSNTALNSFQAVSGFVEAENSSDNFRLFWDDFNKSMLIPLIAVANTSEKSRFD
jgi:hypothetical protein